MNQNDDMETEGPKVVQVTASPWVWVAFLTVVVGFSFLLGFLTRLAIQ